MALVSAQRISDGCSISGKFGESLQITERWQIRVDSPLTSKADIVGGVTGAAGITWGTPHWEVPSVQAMEFECAPTGRDGLRWILTVKYYAPEPKKKPKENGIPEDIWSREGGATSVPAFTDVDGDTIVNSAKDPLEGLERERDERSWGFTKYYETDAELQADIDACSGKVNSGAWGGGDEKTWKCYFRNAKRITTTKLDGEDDAGLLHYIEGNWEFRYDPDTWKLMPWDVGFMEIKDGEKVAILTSDGKAVKQPVALNTDGSAKTAGSPPSVVNNGDGIDVYETASFSATFGDPQLMPQAPPPA